MKASKGENMKGNEMVLSGGQIIMEELLAHGVDTVFGFPGGAVLDIYDALEEYSDRINHVITAHEQGACHAADGYGRASGKTGVVFATSGPGATNLVTGIATAWMDSVPLVAITGNVSSPLIGRDAFQEIYITGITMPITKHNFLVNKVEDISDAIRDAFRIANSGRKGPVLVDITKDATQKKCNYERRSPMVLPEPLSLSDEDAAEIARLINESEKPLIYAGGGIISSETSEVLCRIARKADIPVCYSMMGAGLISHGDPLNLGMIGMHGSISANVAADECDLLLAFGVRFPDRVALNTEKFAENATIVHVDADRGELNKNVKADVAVKADLSVALPKLDPLIEDANHAEWIKEVSSHKERQVEDEVCEGSVDPKSVMESICDMAGPETLVVTDVGQHQMWAAQFVRHVAPRRFITSGGLGTMGFGYGAAIGTKVAMPESPVVHITGDGSFHMNMNEGCTVASYNLPVITVILNNQVLGMVYQWQTQFYGKRYSQTILERKTDYMKVAEGFGIKAFRVTSSEEFKECFEKALALKEPVWIECVLDRECRVLPMIPGGGTIEDMIIE